jgi:hypothetical protein
MITATPTSNEQDSVIKGQLLEAGDELAPLDVVFDPLNGLLHVKFHGVMPIVQRLAYELIEGLKVLRTHVGAAEHFHLSCHFILHNNSNNFNLGICIAPHLPSPTGQF